jgi:hypothetical protein
MVSVATNEQPFSTEDLDQSEISALKLESFESAVTTLNHKLLNELNQLLARPESDPRNRKKYFCLVKINLLKRVNEKNFNNIFRIINTIPAILHRGENLHVGSIIRAVYAMGPGVDQQTFNQVLSESKANLKRLAQNIKTQKGL